MGFMGHLVVLLKDRCSCRSRTLAEQPVASPGVLHRSFCRVWSHAKQLMLVQGMCTNEQCPYAHVNVDPAAPICQDFVRGHCPRGTACPRRHMTPRMIRASKILAAKRLVSRRHICSRAGHCLVLSSLFAVFEAPCLLCLGSLLAFSEGLHGSCSISKLMCLALWLACIVLVVYAHEHLVKRPWQLQHSRIGVFCLGAVGVVLAPVSSFSVGALLAAAALPVYSTWLCGFRRSVVLASLSAWVML